MSNEINLLRQNEAWDLLRSVKDLATSQLMNQATYYLLKRFMTPETAPAADLDLRFFMEIMAELFNDQETLRRILNGEDLRMWTDDE